MSDSSSIFIDVTSLPEGFGGFVQLLSIGAVYGYLLMNASNMISDGSELLLLVPSMSGLVGSVVLPVLGAVPDGCIVLFSGMGPNAQEELNVGVGALAGSTIMLLTAPWFLSVIGGRVNIVNGVASYKSPKLTPPNALSLLGTGVSVGKLTNKGAYIMMLTALTYFFLQIPAVLMSGKTEEEVAEGESFWSLIGLILCIVFFFSYLYYQYLIKDLDMESGSSQKDIIEVKIREAIAKEEISLLGVMNEYLKDLPSASTSSYAKSESSPLVPSDTLAMLKRLLRPFFKKYDADGNDTLELVELSACFNDLGEKPTPKELQTIFRKMDRLGRGSIQYEDFVEGVVEYLLSNQKLQSLNKTYKFDKIQKSVNDDDEEEEEEEEMPEDLASLPPDEQQKRIIMRSLWMLGVGTAIVLVISDPMVAVLSEIGKRTGIPAFYVAFVLAPLASNASEVIASYNYALKKTSKSIAISMSALEGAAIMNNTFCLGIFCFLIYSQELAWEFFAETLSIFLVQMVVGIYALKSTHTVFDACMILALYPASLFLVSFLTSLGYN